MRRPGSHNEGLASLAAWLMVAGGIGALATAEIYDGSKEQTAAQFALGEVPTGYQREDEGQLGIPEAPDHKSHNLSGMRAALDVAARARLSRRYGCGSR